MRAENARKEDINSNIRPLAYRRAFGIIIPLCLAALMLGGAIISVGNDIYAFVKPDVGVTLRVDEPLDLASLSRRLQDEGIIKNPTVFSLFIKSKGRQEKLEAFVGEVALNRNMSYREIMLTLS